jgi:predicted ATP-grasp superfamily ATP-dependent carboligase
MDAVTWHDRPSLRRPVLLAAFEGWNDAADAATTAARYLASAWGTEVFATIDPEEFYDFTEVRPTVSLADDLTRQVEWPAPELSFGRLAGTDRDVVMLLAPEPQLKWRTFCGAVVGVAMELGCELAVSLGALLNDTPHTRPTRVSGTAHGETMAAVLGLTRSRYEGPTGIVGVLQEALSVVGIPSASLWASVPHYVSRTPSPMAALALVERCAALLHATVDTAELAEAAEEYRQEVDDVVAADPEAAAYVRGLESADHEPDFEDVSADDLAVEAERFLREQGRRD